MLKANVMTEMRARLCMAVLSCGFRGYLSGLSMVSVCGAVVLLASGPLRPTHSPAVG
jgi:hypothetical protein